MSSGSVSYRTLFSLPGRAFVMVSALARLPLAMSQLGTLLRCPARRYRDG